MNETDEASWRFKERRKQLKENKKLEEWLDDHNARVQAQFRRWLVRGLLAFSAIALTSVVALAGFGIVLAEQQDFAEEIQQQRVDNIRRECESTNARNQATKLALQKGSEADLKTADPRRQREIEQDVAVTITLIDAVLPKQDCDAVVTTAVPDTGTD